MSNKYRLEENFDPTFTAVLAQREKQIQQNYRPNIGIHKWFARRPGSLFRNLLLAEFNGDNSPDTSYWKSHNYAGVIADPFMGGGTSIFEANRLGFNVVGTDINPISFWIVRQCLIPLDIESFINISEAVTAEIDQELGHLYITQCSTCFASATVKYFIWVKTERCPECATDNDLFPGYLLAEDVRHPRHVVACCHCGYLNEYDRQPDLANPEPCQECNNPVAINGVAKKNKISCRTCGVEYKYPAKNPTGSPKHRMWAIEYHCAQCKPNHEGRFFKKPGPEDLERFVRAEAQYRAIRAALPIPEDEIPEGDETKRLHRWGYTHFHQMFNSRQLLGLGMLLRRIMTVQQPEARHALLTVFSDFLRYQNMLCRYDTYALKCQDIFSVHGFPVGLVQCENSLLGIPKVGSGSFRHFVDKYRKAKQYCFQPFETKIKGRKKELVPTTGEQIAATLVERFPGHQDREAYIVAVPAQDIQLPAESLDGVFTDPPYFDNVQYAELMDFCYAWLRLGLGGEFEMFRPTTTRAHAELTGNTTMGRGLMEFTSGLSGIFCHYSAALKTNAPFVFTYHHNDPTAYVPLIVAILDAGLDCTATLPAPAEMAASLHIAGSKSSILDSVFVCRKYNATGDQPTIEEYLRKDIASLSAAGLKLSEGDLRCLLAGHIARLAINRLRDGWNAQLPLADRVSVASKITSEIGTTIELSNLMFLKQSSEHSGETCAAAI